MSLMRQIIVNIKVFLTNLETGQGDKTKETDLLQHGIMSSCNLT